MDNLVGSPTGLIHLVSSVLAMVFGAAVLFLPKGTIKHKKLGYCYVVCMTIMLATSFMLYRLFGGFGVFHVASVFSTITLIGGMYPIWVKKPKGNYIGYHFAFMYWSVIGLYAAFFSEVLTRVPKTPFFGMVGIASALTFAIGAYYFSKKKQEWFAIYNKNP